MTWAMAGFPGGEYLYWNYFLLIIDWGEVIEEGDESNNTAAAEMCP